MNYYWHSYFLRVISNELRIIFSWGLYAILGKALIASTFSVSWPVISYPQLFHTQLIWAQQGLWYPASLVILHPYCKSIFSSSSRCKYKLTQTEYEWSKFGYESTEYETSLETKWLDTLCKWSRYMCLFLNHADAKLTISYNFFLNLPMLHCIEMCILEINLARCSVFNLYFGFFNTQ